MNDFYSKNELSQFKFKSIGDNVLISKKTSIYGSENMSFGSNVRIDDFCILSGNISIGNNVHISAYVALYGGGSIVINDYCGCSSRCTLLSASDDFSGEFMVGAVIDDNFTNVIKGYIILEKYVQLGANTIILPNVKIMEGTVTGALTLVTKDLNEWGIYVGIPAKFLKQRSNKLLERVIEYEKR